MKNYTIIYGDWFKRGSVRGSVTKYKHIVTDDLNKWLYTNTEIDMGNVWFVFEGHVVEAK